MVLSSVVSGGAEARGAAAQRVKHVRDDETIGATRCAPSRGLSSPSTSPYRVDWHTPSNAHKSRAVGKQAAMRCSTSSGTSSRTAGRRGGGGGKRGWMMRDIAVFGVDTAERGETPGGPGGGAQKAEKTNAGLGTHNTRDETRAAMCDSPGVLVPRSAFLGQERPPNGSIDVEPGLPHPPSPRRRAVAAAPVPDATSPPPSRPSKAPSSTPSTASSAARASQRWRWLIMSVLALLTATCFAATGFYLASRNHSAQRSAPAPPPLDGGGDAALTVDASDWKAAPALGRPLIGEERERVGEEEGTRRRIERREGEERDLLP